MKDAPAWIGRERGVNRSGDSNSERKRTQQEDRVEGSCAHCPGHRGRRADRGAIVGAFAALGDRVVATDRDGDGLAALTRHRSANTAARSPR